MGPKNFGQKIFGSIKLGPKKFLVRKEIFEIKLRSEKNFGLKKLLVRKNFRFNKIAGPKILGPEKILGLKKILVSKNILVHKNYDPQKLGPKDLVKIGPITAEILLTWTNVTKAYVAWTNVTITVGIFQTWSKEPTFKVW